MLFALPTFPQFARGFYRKGTCMLSGWEGLKDIYPIRYHILQYLAPYLAKVNAWSATEGTL